MIIIQECTLPGAAPGVHRTVCQVLGVSVRLETSNIFRYRNNFSSLILNPEKETSLTRKLPI